ncbi:Ku protein (plasmid) [Rhizobium ruizarguesonis]|uniref:non-homologous end joining protein Ku n=1 Tax=Rhizobium/Agrobacterium group TaxID=227290 RepID=UPI000DD561AD|nr:MULTISPECIES: Ku protein [Rhizobium/Agrobacterium group]MDP9762490.1 DNA end-binding protein Ku [Agrobacterium tumefaciens]MDQ1220389.1 DNA end-binding protein Ku [Agrobacterium sp. SORGH_AS_0745]NKK81260.1 Ku protein [Rhizobium leguminosarum bv. viciae]NTZ63524.1 Ku protein [Agrobacterium tumefaciens]TAW83752.1 Ku protein [Rhizobium ruizarguesonis]
MVAPRANWKGFIKFGEVACPVALYTAASSSERIAFNTLNRKTGNRVKREFVDSETGDPVERDDQVKGYEVENGQYIVLEPDEVAAAVPDSDKTLKIDAFIPCNEIDGVYFDKPYYLAPDKMGTDAFVLLRDGMKKAKVAAIARTVLFRRVRTVLIRPHGKGLIATTLNFDYEVRSSEDAFEELPDLKIEGEMLELAEHIIGTKKGSFDARTFDDRYEAAVAELVKAKIEGRALPKKKAPAASKPSDLLQALRESAGIGGMKAEPKRAAANVNKGTSRQKAAKPAAAKTKSAASQTRRAG